MALKQAVHILLHLDNQESAMRDLLDFPFLFVSRRTSSLLEWRI